MGLTNTDKILQKVIESEDDHLFEIDKDEIRVVNQRTDEIEYKLGAPDILLVKNLLDFLGFETKFH